MTLLGIDYGGKRIGVATGNLGLKISTPLTVIQNDASVIDRIKKIVTEYRVSKIVMGLPLYKDGNESPLSITVKGFGTMLQEQLGLEVVYQNELLSSNEAQIHIKENMNIRDPKKIKELIDKVAASMVLQEYMESQGGK